MKLWIQAAAAAAIAAVMPMMATSPAQAECYLISNTLDSDSLRNTIKNALGLTGEQMGGEVESRNPPTGDIAAVEWTIQHPEASGPDDGPPRPFSRSLYTDEDLEKCVKVEN